MTPTPDEIQIRAQVDDWAEAVRSKDMDRVLEHHADDIVMFDAPMPLQSQGIEEYRKTWELFFAQSPGGQGSFDVTELKIAAGDTVAYCHAILKILDSKARLTIGMRKDNKHWLVEHEHHSYPIE
jgi:ketosteroid isomerase-like protein